MTTTRVRRENTLQEIYTWVPITRFAYDDSRQLMNKIRQLIGQTSIHQFSNNLQLIDINYFDNNIVFLYNILGDIEFFPTFVIKEIEYYPTLRRKSCKNCINLKSWDNKLICMLRT